MDYEEYRKWHRLQVIKDLALKIFFLVTLCVIILVIVNLKDEPNAPADMRTDWEIAVDEDYAFYLDGNKVDPGTVAEDLYETRYDKEQKKVFMTKKVKNDTVIIPIPVS